MPNYVLLFGVFMLGMALGALLTTIHLKGVLVKVIREEMKRNREKESEESGGSTKSDAA